jgi:hypothetical protein
MKKIYPRNNHRKNCIDIFNYLFFKKRNSKNTQKDFNLQSSNKNKIQNEKQKIEPNNDELGPLETFLIDLVEKDINKNIKNISNNNFTNNKEGESNHNPNIRIVIPLNNEDLSQGINLNSDSKIKNKKEKNKNIEKEKDNKDNTTSEKSNIKFF